MQFKTITAAALLILGWSFLTATRNPANPPTGKTGAPNETTCSTTASCHSGGTFTGTVEVTGLPDTILPSTSYSLTVTHTSGATKAGFEMTCLNTSNTACGTFSTATGVSIGTLNSKQYPRQSAAKTLSNGSTSWTFPWKSPASLTTTDQLVHFYFASLAANGNGAKTGDNALTGTKTAFFKLTVGTTDATFSQSVRIFPNPTSEVLNLDFGKNLSGVLTIFNAAGLEMSRIETVFPSQVGVSNLPSGLYFLEIEADGKTASRSFVKK